MVGVVVMLKVIVGVICISSAFVHEVAMKNPYGGSCLRGNIQCKSSLVRKWW
jgi:hypothetical protein